MHGCAGLDAAAAYPNIARHHLATAAQQLAAKSLKSLLKCSSYGSYKGGTKVVR
jgi:hypothetical protein